MVSTVASALAAAAAGVATVSLAAAAVETATASSCPTFTMTGQRFDQSQFMGRFSKMILQCDPRLVFFTETQILQAKELIENYKDHAGKDRELWEAKRLVESAMNDKGEFIPQAFRMSGYVPYNGPVCAFMMVSQSTAPLLFWSWVNQSQNALVNYFNRNTGSPITNETIIKSYAAAVGSALVVGFGLATFIQKRYPKEQAAQMLRWVGFPSAVVASSLNCFIVRSPELVTGIPLQDEEGNNVLPGETSLVAAKEAIYSMVISRAILPAPVFAGPPIIMAAVGPVREYLLRKPAMVLPVTTYLLLISFGIGLPATIAFFPQIRAIPATAVEERFQHLKDPQTQQPYTTFYYNKGL